MTRLQGQVTGGLNTTASTNLRDYYSMVKAFQSNRFEPLLAKLDRLLLRSCYGDLPADYWMEWAALDDPTELEQAQVNKTNAETDEIQLRTGAIVPAHVSARINEDGPYELSEEFIEFMKERDGLTTAAKPTEEMTAASTGGGGAEIQSQVLNGAQISGLIDSDQGQVG